MLMFMKEQQAPFADRLAEMIKLPPVGSVKMRVTPDMAAVMLARNESNRPMSRGTVSRYAETMKRGLWAYTRAPIIFAKSGRLQDGQHRLSAVVSSGVPCDFDLVFGDADENFAFIDIGKVRSAGDIFKINGVQHWNAVAAISALVWSYANDAFSFGVSGTTARKITTAELYEFYKNTPSIDKSLKIYNKFHYERLTSPSLMAALHCICANKNRALADQFFTNVAEGLGFTGKKDPAYLLHKRLIDNLSSVEKLGKTTIAALTIKAWNKTREGRDVGTLKYAVDESFPKVR